MKKELEDTKETYQRQLAVKDEHYQRQLAAKDEQINELIKRPRTVHNTTNNRYVVERDRCAEFRVQSFQSSYHGQRARVRVRVKA